MKVFPNRLDSSLCKRICDFATDQILNVNMDKSPVTMWTNFGWPKHIVKDSTAVFCFMTPVEFLEEIESCLKGLEILDPEKDLPLVRQHDSDGHSICLTYVWTPNSYIPIHRDGKYRKTVTVYCNPTWTYEQGGVLQWLSADTGKWETIIPSCGTLILNDQDESHATTPVKQNGFRISLQIFVLPKTQKDASSNAYRY